jgi:hypothetical protein
LANIDFIQLPADILRDINQKLEILKTDAELNMKDEFYDKFFFPLFKALKLIIFISLGRIRILRINETIEKVTKSYLFL